MQTSVKQEARVEVERMYEQPELFALGDTAVTVRFASGFDRKVHERVHALAAYLYDRPFRGMIEAVPALAAVTVFYDPLLVRSYGADAEERTPYECACDRLREAVRASVGRVAAGERREIIIPVCYGGTYGPDLGDVAASCGLSPEKVVRIHLGATYLVHMIGFVPGFPYLGGLPEAIAAPRRKTPRLAVPAGTVGIAGNQTGVYPLATPGGWQLIGRTPLRLFRPEREQPSLLQAGDSVRFAPIDEAAYAELERAEREAAEVRDDD